MIYKVTVLVAAYKGIAFNEEQLQNVCNKKGVEVTENISIDPYSGGISEN